MDSQFDALRAAICDTEDELSRFRKLVVNSVMATDIVGKFSFQNPAAEQSLSFLTSLSCLPYLAL